MSTKYETPRNSTQGKNQANTSKKMIESDIDSPQSTFEGLRYSMSSSSDLISSWDFDTPNNCNKRMLGEILKSDYLQQLQNESIFRAHPNPTNSQPYLNDCPGAKEVVSFENVESVNESSQQFRDIEVRRTDVLYTSEKLEPVKAVSGGIIRQGKYQYKIPVSKKPRNLKVRFADCDVKENFSSELTTTDDDERGCHFIFEYLQCVGPHRY
jgi:hypothetical protein